MAYVGLARLDLYSHTYIYNKSSINIQKWDRGCKLDRGCMCRRRRQLIIEDDMEEPNIIQYKDKYYDNANMNDKHFNEFNDFKHKKCDKPQTPQILLDIVELLKETGIPIYAKVEGEGRAGSLKDEGTVKKLLMEHPKFKKYVEDAKPRACGDIWVKDYNNTTIHVVNIKTSFGSTDNAYSRTAFAYALTDLKAEDLPLSMTSKKMFELLKTNKCDDPNKDLWYLHIDKKDSKNVMIRGAKQINEWKPNPDQSNVMQINWKKEKTMEPLHRTWDEAYNVMIGGVKQSLRKCLANYPVEVLEECLPLNLFRRV
jgi:hypothetical protein